MAKKPSGASKTYLKALGIINIVLAVLMAILAVFLFCSKMTFTDLGLDTNTISELQKQNISEDTFRAIAGGAYIFVCLLYVLIGWLLIRAANNPQKSTFVLVLLVIATVSSTVQLFSAGFSNWGTVLSNTISLIINILAVMAVLRIRREIDE